MLKTKGLLSSICLLFFLWGMMPGCAVATKLVANPQPVVVPAVVESLTPSPSVEPTAAPVNNQSFSISAEIGYDGLLIIGRWMPSSITITNNGADFDGMLCVNSYLSYTEYNRYELPLTLAGGATKRVSLPMLPYMRQDMYAFELVANGKTIAEKRVTPSRVIAPETVAIGVLSGDPTALMYMNQRANGLDTLRGESWLTIPLTPENFPETEDLIACFSMLVVDGVDINTFGEAQQKTLTHWLLNGGIVYVSGGAQAAMGNPFFSKWTGLDAGNLQEVEDITPELLHYAGISGKSPVGESIWLTPLPKEVALVSKNDLGLVSLHAAGKGFIFSTAFDMGKKPMATWTGMPSFWPHALRQSISSSYLNLINRLNEIRYSNNYYSVNDLMRHMKIPNEESGVPILLLILVYLIAAGFGGYLLLKKWDKREWLWLLAPASAVIFALALFLLSQSSTMNKPVALTVSSVKEGKEGTQTTTYIGVSKATDDEMVVSTNLDRLPNVLTDNQYYNDSPSQPDKLFRPVSMRQRYRFGSNPTIGYSAGSAWDVKLMALSDIDVDMGKIDASLWVEEDGIHGEVLNGTDTLLTDCVVLTPFGFDRIDRLLPSQSAQIQLLIPTKVVDITEPNFVPEQGVLYSLLDLDLANIAQQGNHSAANVDSFLTAALGTGKDYNPEAQRKRQFIDLFGFNYYENPSIYEFFAFSDSIGQVDVSVDEKPVMRTAHKAVIASAIKFEPIGPTGQVFFHQGLIHADTVVDEGEDKKPRAPTTTDGEGVGDNLYDSQDNYIRLSNPIALRFQLPEHERYEIEKMTLFGMTYDSVPKLFLYNNFTRGWDEQKRLSISMSGDSWAPYIDEEGSIYLRLIPNEEGNRYDGMNRPVLTLKGKVKE